MTDHPDLAPAVEYARLESLVALSEAVRDAISRGRYREAARLSHVAHFLSTFLVHGAVASGTNLEATP